MLNPDTIASYMAIAGEDSSIQRAQTRYRIALVDAWQIPSGARVLEIACGQGDLTAVLAARVGAQGHVTAIDIAEADYGAPITLGQAHDHLRASPLGDRIEFRTGFDLLDPVQIATLGQFDWVVMAHGAWYFSDQALLLETFRASRNFAPRFGFAEWDLVPRDSGQLAHWLAVVIQGQIEIYKPGSESNIRTPITRSEARDLLTESGWSIATEADLDSSELQDAQWEIDMCLNWTVPEMANLPIPPRHRTLLETQVNVLRNSAAGEVLPLPAYALTCSQPPTT